MMRLAKVAFFLSWLSLILRAETHPHAVAVTYLVGPASLDWATQEYTEDEKRVGTERSAWSVSFNTRTMYDQKTGRKFEAEEAARVGGQMQKFSTFLALEIVKIKPEELVSIFWDIEKRRVEIAFQRNGLETEWFGVDGVLHRENGAVETISEEAQEILWPATKNIITYCLESTLWWRAGRGETTEPTKAEVTHEAVLVAVGR